MCDLHSHALLQSCHCMLQGSWPPHLCENGKAKNFANAPVMFAFPSYGENSENLSLEKVEFFHTSSSDVSGRQCGSVDDRKFRCHMMRGRGKGRSQFMAIEGPCRMKRHMPPISFRYPPHQDLLDHLSFPSQEK